MSAALRIGLLEQSLSEGEQGGLSMRLWALIVFSGVSSYLSMANPMFQTVSFLGQVGMCKGIC